MRARRRAVGAVPEPARAHRPRDRRPQLASSRATRRATRARRAAWSGRRSPSRRRWATARGRGSPTRARFIIAVAPTSAGSRRTATSSSRRTTTPPCSGRRRSWRRGSRSTTTPTPRVQILPDGRVRAYYSAHAGPRMWYRTSLAPEDVTAWGPAQTVPENPVGASGFTYPNPIHLAAEGRTYLFWRGGIEPDLHEPARRIGRLGPASHPDQRRRRAPLRQVRLRRRRDDPYRLHQRASERARRCEHLLRRLPGGALRRADGTVIGTLGTTISPSAADLVFDAPQNAWIHDVAHDDQGRPVLVFASFDPHGPAARLRPSLLVRALDRRALADETGHRRRRVDQRRHARAVLQRRHHARPRGPAHGVPLAPDGRGGLGRRDLEDARRRRDLDVRAGHGGLGHEERPAGLTARDAAVLGRHERPLDARELSVLPQLPDVDRDHPAHGRRRAAGGRRRARPAHGARAAAGRLRRTSVARPGRADRRAPLGLRRRHDRGRRPGRARLHQPRPLLPEAHRDRHRRPQRHLRDRDRRRRRRRHRTRARPRRRLGDADGHRHAARRRLRPLRVRHGRPSPCARPTSLPPGTSRP